jgi:hypothetical protein
MPADLLTDIVRQIDARKRELAAAVHEYERLEAARAALDGTHGSTRDRSAAGQRGTANASRRAGVARSAARRSGGARRRTKAPARPRAPRGANRAAFLGALRERPGSSVAEVAEATGVHRAVLYQLRRRLLEEGAVVEQQRDDGRKGYSLPGR